MRRLFPFAILYIAITLTALGSGQQPTIARLNHEAMPDIPHGASLPPPNSIPPSPRRTTLPPESALARRAARALFVNSDLNTARVLAKLALQRDRHDAEALFVQMEVAGMRAEQAVMLDAATRLCELGGADSDDPRVQLAAVRLRESAANTPEFLAVLPRVKALPANSSQHWPELEYALLNAAMDGVPGLDPYVISRAAGILTDWRIVGVPGRHPQLDASEETANGEDLGQASYKDRLIENFQFPDGRMVLPDYLPHRGTFYASSRFAAVTEGNWTVSAEGGALEIYIDGREVLRVASPAGTKAHHSATLEVTAGPHRVLVQFAPSAAPLRVSISQTASRSESPLRPGLSLEEATYQLAARDYAAGDFGSAVKQIDAVSSATSSAPLQYLLAETLDHTSPTSSDSTTAWHRVMVLAPDALAADEAMAKRSLASGNLAEAVRLADRVLDVHPECAGALETITAAANAGAPFDWTANESNNVWQRRLQAHPSCAAWEAAIRFYRSQHWPAAGLQHQLNGCAPESLDYAESLSQQGNHPQAVEALNRLLAAAPLNRAARQMLVRELQMAGEDAAAQRAAAEWVRIAPNAEKYHRLAAGEVEAVTGSEEFYRAYRRDAMAAAGENLGSQLTAGAMVLLDDHVAVSRPDGSVSLYVHTATQMLNRRGIERFGNLNAPQGAKVLELRVIHPDGTAEEVAGSDAVTADSLVPGDEVDQEYVINYTGDGGIPEHSEAFQFVFGSFEHPVLHARFVVLTPAEHADRGVVIATGEVPHMSMQVQDGMLAREWQKDTAIALDQDTSTAANRSLAIVRIVEQDNGWSMPSNAEHHRKIDTIHPGPRFEDSSFVGGVEPQGSSSRSL